MMNADSVSNQTDNTPETPNKPDSNAPEVSPQAEATESSPQNLEVQETKQESAKVETDTPIAEEKTSESEPQEAPESKAASIDEKTQNDEPETELTPDKKDFEEVYAELQEVRSKGKTIEVEVKERIRGGLRVIYKEMPLFLPTSHFDMKRNPSDQEINDIIGKTLSVHIHDLQEDETKRKTAIVSRKKVVEDEFWSSMSVGKIVEGTVTSIAHFGVFLDLGGVEGLIHISQLSQMHVDDPKKFAKRGEVMKVKVVEVDHERKRIALSAKELEESPWKGAEEEFPAGSRVKGIIRRINEFGTYIELKPGVDGLLRTSELSWTRRIQSPTEILQRGQEIEVEVMNIDEERQIAALSYKRTRPNPWNELKERFPVDEEAKGTVLQLGKQGAVINIENMVDGFMPRSTMMPLMKGKKVPFEVGDIIDVVIDKIIPEQESIIITPKLTEEQLEYAQKQAAQRSSGPRRGGDNRNRGGAYQGGHSSYDAPQSNASEGSFSLGDLLSDQEKEKLLKGN